jgi:hypothetical protein
MNEGPEVAASEPSNPLAPQQNEQESTIMSEATDNPYPVDPTGPPSIRSIPEEDLGPLFDATDDRRFDIDMVPSLERLRQAVAEVQPRDLTGSDVRGIVELIKSALDSDSQWADRVRADEAVRMRPVDLDATSPKALAEVITRSLDDLDKAIADATRLGVPLPGLSPGDARAAEVAVNTRRRFDGFIESGD